MTYLDRTFCLDSVKPSRRCKNTECFRYFTDGHKERARNMNVSIGDFHNPKVGLKCPNFKGEKDG
jgi:hypothetical protein